MSEPMDESWTGADTDVGAVALAPDGPAFAPLSCVALADREALEVLLAQRGFALLRLDGTRIRDKASLLAQVRADLPPVADLVPGNWDALADYLRNVLLDLEQDRVALLWTDADRIVDGDLQDFVDALQVIAGVTGDTWRWTPRPVTLLTFLIGDGPRFRRLGAGHPPAAGPPPMW